MDKIGCCSVVFNNQSQVLAIDCNKGRGIILPGGKWEPPETFKQCAARELEEETGLIAIHQELIFSGFNVDGWFSYVFRTRVRDFDFKITPEGSPLWVPFDRLFDSSFKGFYELLEGVI